MASKRLTDQGHEVANLHRRDDGVYVGDVVAKRPNLRLPVTLRECQWNAEGMLINTTNQDVGNLVKKGQADG